jgi:hypothetical protein
MTAWFVCMVAMLATYVWAYRKQGPQFAAGIAVIASLTAPIWVQFPLFEVPSNTIVGGGVDLRVAMGTSALVGYLFSKRSTYILAMTPCDLAMIGLVVVHLLSDLMNDGWSWKILMHMYGEWWVPYVAGRIAFQFRNDIQRMIAWLSAVAIFLAVLSIIESTVRVNLWEVFFGIRPPEQSARELYRWGLRRSYGPCLNQIYFGVLQVLLLPWPTVAALRAIQRKMHVAWLLAPAVCILGIVGTGSRGPIFGVGIMFFVMIFLIVRKLRIPLIITGLLGMVLMFTYLGQVVATLERWSGEHATAARSKVVINEDEEVQYSGLRNRFILFDLYRIAMSRSGLLGFGTDAVTGFPVNVPLGAQEVSTLRKIRFIDNTYILLTLRFGYLGLAFFTLAGIAAVVQMFTVQGAYSIAHKQLGQLAQLVAAALAGSLTATLVILLTVWMPPDFGFVLIWGMGASSGLLLAHGRKHLAKKSTN